jgi:hypothetical protein
MKKLLSLSISCVILFASTSTDSLAQIKFYETQGQFSIVGAHSSAEGVNELGGLITLRLDSLVGIGAKLSRRAILPENLLLMNYQPWV